MPEKKIKFPFPTPNSPQVDAYDVTVSESTERWTDVTLDDGTILRIKPTVLGAIRIDGQFDPTGNPQYALKLTNAITIVSAPDRLRKGTTDSQIQ